jgi:hypothetical protein
MGTFTERMDMLEEQVRGRWSARCEVNQIYAHYQEVHPEFHHPRGGQAFYLRDTVYHGQWLAKAAHGLIGEGGVDLRAALRGVAEGMALGVEARAPVEFNDLRRSGRPYVTRDFAEVYSRTANVGRLSDAELRHKSEFRYLYFGR